MTGFYPRNDDHVIAKRHREKQNDTQNLAKKLTASKRSFIINTKDCFGRHVIARRYAEAILATGIDCFG